MKNKVKLKDMISEFENSSGSTTIENELFEELTENLTESDIEQVNNAFHLLTLFYSGML